MFRIIRAIFGGENSSLSQRIFQGHPGCTNGWQTLRRYWYFSRSDAWYKEQKKACDGCQRGKQRNNQRKVKAPLHIIECPPANFCHVNIDLFGPYPRSNSGNTLGMLMVCRSSGYPEVVAIPDKTMETTTYTFYTNVICRYGPPKLVTYDRGSDCVNSMMKNLQREFNYKGIKTSPNNPQANGKAERWIQTFKNKFLGFLENKLQLDPD